VKGDGKMKQRLVGLIAAVFFSGSMLMLTCPGAGQDVTTGTGANNSPSGAPVHLSARLSDLRDLALLDSPDLTSEERSHVLIRWLAEERAEPVGHAPGYGGTVIDTSWVQSQIIMSMGISGDPRLLTAMADPGVRDGIIIALGWMGDASRTSELLRILATHEQPDVRALAATVLGRLGASEAEPGLRAALADEFSREGTGPGGVRTVYPVRQAAEAALRMLDDEAAMQRATELRRAFVAAMNPGAGEEDPEQK
jgi:hypothetical protein